MIYLIDEVINGAIGCCCNPALGQLGCVSVRFRQIHSRGRRRLWVRCRQTPRQKLRDHLVAGVKCFAAMPQVGFEPMLTDSAPNTNGGFCHQLALVPTNSFTSEFAYAKDKRLQGKSISPPQQRWFYPLTCETSSCRHFEFRPSSNQPAHPRCRRLCGVWG